MMTTPVVEKDKEFTPAVKKKILVAVLIALTIGNMMILNVVTLIPDFIETNEWDLTNEYTLNSGDIGLIISMFSFAQIIFAPFNGSIKNALGAKNTIIIGFALLTISTVGLGYIEVFKDPETFKILAILLRFI